MKEKIKIGVLSLGLTYAGSFFGAGFVSGKEIYEFFGSFGKIGYLGLALAILLFALFGILLIRNVQLSGKSSIDEVIILMDSKVLRTFLGTITVFIMFGILVVMTAGVGALINRVLDFPDYVGCLLFITCVCFAAMYGLSGAVKVFTVLVPILVVTTLVICITALNRYGLTFDYPSVNNNPLLANWWFSAFTYVSYNMITLIGTVIPVGACVNKKSTVYGGIISGCLFAMSIALGILMAVTSIFTPVNAELPMLEIAFTLHNAFGFIYAILLLFAMYGTSLSSLVAIIVYFNEKIHTFTKYKIIIIWVIGILAFFGSLAGFGNLINTVYPIFGYIGFVILAMILGNFIYLKFKK